MPFDLIRGWTCDVIVDGEPHPEGGLRPILCGKPALPRRNPIPGQQGNRLPMCNEHWREARAAL